MKLLKFLLSKMNKNLADDCPEALIRLNLTIQDEGVDIGRDKAHKFETIMFYKALES